MTKTKERVEGTGQVDETRCIDGPGMGKTGRQ